MAIVVLPANLGVGISIGGVILDTTESEEYRKGYTVTENPVEGDEPVSDHVQPQPDEVTLSGIISATPISDDDIYVGRAEDILAQLKALAATREPFDFFGGVQSYTSMVIQSIGITQDNDTGLSTRYSLSLKQVRRARFREVDVPPSILAPKAGRQGTKPSDTLNEHLDVAQLNQLLLLDLREKAAREQLEAAITSEDVDVQLGARAELSAQPETAALLDEVLGGGG